MSACIQSLLFWVFNWDCLHEHEFLKAIIDDLRKKSSTYIAKCLLLSTYMPQVKSINKNKKDLPLVVPVIMTNPMLLLLVVLLIPLMILLAKLHLSKKIVYWREL